MLCHPDATTLNTSRRTAHADGKPCSTRVHTFGMLSAPASLPQVHTSPAAGQRAGVARLVVPRAVSVASQASSPPPPNTGPTPVDIPGTSQVQHTAALPQHWEEQLKKAPLGKARVLRQYCKQLERINGWEPKLKVLTDEQLKLKTAEFKSRLQAGTGLDQLLPEAFAVVREVSSRVLGLRHFDSQMIGGMVLHDGQVAEMSTGEGKTLVATLPAYLNALTGQSVHVVTVNDYLASRDAEWMGKVFGFLGLSCAAVNSGMTIPQYKAAYACNITYVTGQELGFSYLRDNTAASPEDLVLPAVLNYAIVDEADSVLIDESRVPLITSLPMSSSQRVVSMVDKLVRPMWEEVQEMSELYANNIRNNYFWRAGGEEELSDKDRQAMERDIQQLTDRVKSRYFKVDMKTRTMTLTSAAIQRLLEGLVAEGVTFRSAAEAGRAPVISDVFEDPAKWGQLAVTSFKAYELYARGKQYIVRDDRVIVVNEHTGRLLENTRWQEGLHQAIEAKEGVPVKEDNHATAVITFQLFFKFYNKLSGMTGTAAPAAAEFFELYKLKVVQVPTNKPVRRVDLPSRFYFDAKQRADELCRIVEMCWLHGRPVLIGTSSVQQSEAVLAMLLEGTSGQVFGPQRAGVQVLNASPEKVRIESQIVSQAGLPGSVTIATNMAGRGTDIILGGSAEGLTKLVIMRLVYSQMMSDVEAATIPQLPFQLQFSPLGRYDKRDMMQVMAQVKAAAGQPGLPLELHMALMGAMLMADAEAQKFGRGSSSSSTDVTAAPAAAQHLDYSTAVELSNWVMGMADSIRREAYERIRDKFRDLPLSELEYTVCLAPVLADVLLEREPSYSLEPQGQVFALKAAVMLWAWLDQQCEMWSEQVRAQGGLLVLGMSIQESRRVELQLRGRAGRQGDPGTTLMMYDLYDPKLLERGFAGVFDMVRQVDARLGTIYLDGPIVSVLISTIQRESDSIYSNARLEMKRYDEIVEQYRASVYSLRRLILSGSNQQCTQLIYMFIQAWVDQLVEEHLGSGSTRPTSWLHPTVPVNTLPLELRPKPTGTSATSAGLVGAASGVTGTHQVQSQQQQQEGDGLMGAWEVLMRSLEQLVNPVGRVGHVQWDMRDVQDSLARDSTLRNILMNTGVIRKERGGEGGGVELLSMPMSTRQLTVLTPDQMVDLAAFITGAQRPRTETSETADHVQKQPGGWLSWLAGRRGQAELTWPKPPMSLTARQHLSVMTHARVYNMRFNLGAVPAHLASQQQATGSGSSSQGSASTLPGGATATTVFSALTGLPETVVQGMASRPALDGRWAGHVSSIRDYLGLVMIQALEQRRVVAIKSLLAQGAVQLDMDAQDVLAVYEREVMLQWLDGVWSVFLEEVDGLKKAVAVKAYSGSDPLSEFQLEANRSFLGMLATYREAVVAKVMVPEINMYSQIDEPVAPVADVIGSVGDARANLRTAGAVGGGGGGGGGGGSSSIIITTTPGAAARGVDGREGGGDRPPAVKAQHPLVGLLDTSTPVSSSSGGGHSDGAGTGGEAGAATDGAQTSGLQIAATAHDSHNPSNGQQTNGSSDSSDVHMQVQGSDAHVQGLWGADEVEALFPSSSSSSPASTTPATSPTTSSNNTSSNTSNSSRS